MIDVLRVEKPGPLTTVQDLGRPHAVSAGVPTGGAMDRFAHRAANLLAGNDEAAATLECTLKGPSLVALEACRIAVTGADFDLRINGRPQAMWTGLELQPGDRVEFGQRVWGARVYIAAAGGIAGDRWLGSRSTYLLAARGGMHGRALAAGDVLTLAGSPAAVPVRRFSTGLLPAYRGHELPAIGGPHLARLDADSRRALFESTFSVARDANRMGYRLEGPPLRAPGDELLSFGLVAGVVQVVHSGQPIILMADHSTAGGYPVVATVAGAAMPVAAQLLPGDELHFAEVSVGDALEMRGAQRAALASIT